MLLQLNYSTVVAEHGSYMYLTGLCTVVAERGSYITVLLGSCN